MVNKQCIHPPTKAANGLQVAAWTKRYLRLTFIRRSYKSDGGTSDNINPNEYFSNGLEKKTLLTEASGGNVAR